MKDADTDNKGFDTHDAPPSCLCVMHHLSDLSKNKTSNELLCLSGRCCKRL